MKNLSCFCKSNLFNLTLFLQLYLLFSLSENHYGDCLHKKCGSFDITYPFYIIDQQQPYCGYPGFEVNCTDERFPVVNMSGNNYVIKNISYGLQQFEVVNSVFDGDGGGGGGGAICFDSLRNVSWERDIFQFAGHHDQVFLFRDCPNKVVEENWLNRVKCGGIAVDGKDPKLKNIEEECNGLNVITLPYYDKGGVEFVDSNITHTLERGMLLNWKAYNCTACAESGGQCGFDVVNNQFNCYCPDRTHALSCKLKNGNLPLILGLSLGGGVFVLLAFVAIWHRKKLKFRRPKVETRSVSLDHSTSDLERGNMYFGVPLFSYSELLEATDNFNESKELGDGGFGTVYYGKLKDGREVAVKRLYEKSFRRVEQFMNEVRILTCLRHQNLVSLYGCTSQYSKELLLVYEYVENGTVADHLFGDKGKPGSLTWPIRLRIAIEAASALSYLHASDIIHRDVKTSNILVDSSFRVRVADFGLSRLFPTDVTHVSTAPQGTPGYIDPEYHQCYQLTDKSDVYSFGVVLIELISSLPAIDMERHRHEINLSNYATNRIQQCAFNELVDPQLGSESDSKVRKMTTMVAELAFQCLQHEKEFRPTMDEVLETLTRIESTDIDSLQTDEMCKNTDEVVKLQNSQAPPSPVVENDHTQLLNHNRLHPPSPISVMDKWESRSTMHSNSKDLCSKLTDR